MLLASFSRSPLVLVREVRSEPARSTRDSCDTITLVLSCIERYYMGEDGCINVLTQRCATPTYVGVSKPICRSNPDYIKSSSDKIGNLAILTVME